MLFFQTHFHSIVIVPIDFENDEEFSIFNPVSENIHQVKDIFHMHQC